MDGNSKESKAVCRFGPGGDFVCLWPKGPMQQQESSAGRLSKLLSYLSEIISAVLGSEFEGREAKAPNIQSSTENVPRRRKDSGHALKNSKTNTYPSSVRIIKNGRLFESEPRLFADDWRISGRGGHKPKHHIRAYQRTAKKRSALVLCWQGSLFGTERASAKTA